MQIIKLLSNILSKKRGDLFDDNLFIKESEWRMSKNEKLANIGSIKKSEATIIIYTWPSQSSSECTRGYL